MKLNILVLSILIAGSLQCQDLPINPNTGLVSIKDSLELKNKSVQEVKDMLTKWSYSLLDVGNLDKVYKLDNSKQTEKVYINLPLGSILTQDKGGNRFVTSGTLTYTYTKTKGLVVTANFGGVKFDYCYTITAKKIIYEFTNLEYSHDMAHYGKFEEEKPPSDNYNNSLIFKMSKKEWAAVRVEYFDKLQTLASNLKEYIVHYMQSNQAVTSQSPINYESYKKIATGMSYDDVAKLLGDEGKELSNNSSQVNGKTIILQTVVWHDLDKTKSITVTFADGKVQSKSQTNL